MQSHWEKLKTIRVVDAGYLLAGMEPERKWQFAPPIVANFFNLIRDVTGAVKLATLPGERMEITQAEFQALRAEYGTAPPTEPKASPLVTVPHESPRDSKPWETLVPFYEPIQGVFMYQQAAREIADAEGWNDSQLVALEAEMLWAINDKSLTLRDRKTGMESKHDAWEVMKLVTVEDVNTWLEKRRVSFRWDRLTNKAPARPVVTAKRRTWRDVAMQYIVETYRSGKYRTAHTFYVALVNKAEAGNSPFTRHNRELFLTDLGQSVAEKTIANEIPKIKAAARQPQILSLNSRSPDGSLGSVGGD